MKLIFTCLLTNLVKGQLDSELPDRQFTISVATILLSNSLKRHILSLPSCNLILLLYFGLPFGPRYRLFFPSRFSYLELSTMHFHPLASAAIISTILFPFLTSAMNLDCERIVTDKIHWDLSKLGGPKSTLYYEEEASRRTTYTIDLCRPLKRVDKVDAAHQCPSGTRGKFLLSTLRSVILEAMLMEFQFVELSA